MKRFTTIEEIMNELENGKYNYYAFRNITEHDTEVIESGREYLDCSHNWIDNEDTGEELNGTCGIGVIEWFENEEIMSRYEQCRNNYIGNVIVLIADNSSEYGEDENEVILGSNGYGANVIGYVEL